MTVVDVTIVRLPDHDVARLLPNSSRDNQVGARIAHGEHTVQLSVDLSAEMVERAKRASGIWIDSTDVPPSSGGFPGGFVGSSVQGSRAAGQDNERRKVTNAKQD